jgi:hypothetical protein
VSQELVVKMNRIVKFSVIKEKPEEKPVEGLQRIDKPDWSII